MSFTVTPDESFNPTVFTVTGPGGYVIAQTLNEYVAYSLADLAEMQAWAKGKPTVKEIQALWMLQLELFAETISGLTSEAQTAPDADADAYAKQEGDTSPSP